jgi:hypothetical protein
MPSYLSAYRRREPLDRRKSSTLPCSTAPGMLWAIEHDVTDAGLATGFEPPHAPPPPKVSEPGVALLEGDRRAQRHVSAAGSCGLFMSARSS